MTSSVFDLFKLIMGIIISIMILVFIVNYSKDFTGLQRDTQRAITVENFKKLAERVYLTGEPETFDGFSKLDFSLSFYPLEDPPEIGHKSGRTTIFIPTLLSPGKELLLTRASIDYGWWRFDTVIAIPQTMIVFTPLENTEENLEIINEIAETFSAYSGYTPNITFGLCNGQDLLFNVNTFDITYEIGNNVFEKCAAILPKHSKLVTISGQCSIGLINKGVCINPNKEIFIAGSDLGYPYKDMLDIIFVVIGNDQKDLFNKIDGEKLYKYKNKIHGKSLSLAAKINSEKQTLIENDLEKIKKEIDEIGPSTECKESYREMSRYIDDTLTELQSNNIDRAEIFLNYAKNSYDGILISCLRLSSDNEHKFDCAVLGFTQFRPVLEDTQKLAEEQSEQNFRQSEELEVKLGQSSGIYLELVDRGCE